MEQTATPEAVMLGTFLVNYATPILVIVIGGSILAWIKKLQKRIDDREAHKENRAKLLDIKIESMIYAMGQVNSGIGDVFKREYEIKKSKLMKETEFVNEKQAFE